MTGSKQLGAAVAPPLHPPVTATMHRSAAPLGGRNAQTRRLRASASCGILLCIGRRPLHLLPVDPRRVVRQYVERCARSRKPASVEALARFMRLPAARLAQELRRKYDVSPRELLWEAQVALAKSILAEEPDLPLKEVAARSGVSGVRNLHRIFKRVEGVAPGAARMRLS